MNLAFHDVRRNAGRFLGTSFGVALLFTVVLAMAGIYQGLVDDATTLLETTHTDIWIVQQGTRGPFADASRLDSTVEARAAALPFVTRARAFTYQILQRDHDGVSLRFALMGVAYPEDRGEQLPLIAGRAIAQPHDEIVVDASLGLPIGSHLSLAGEDFRVVGLTRQLLGSGGDAVIVATVADAQVIAEDAPSDALRTERERRAARLFQTDLGTTQPALRDLLFDPRFRPPVLATSPIAAVLVNVDSSAHGDAVRAAIAAWPDVSAYTTEDEKRFLLDGVVEKPRKQLGLFSMILVATSSVLIAAVVYMTTLDKAHDIAVLKLMGARWTRIAGMVLQQAWMMGIVGYGIAVAIGSQAFPHFPRRVVLTTMSIAGVGALVLVVSTVASLVGVAYALRVDPGKALEG